MPAAKVTCPHCETPVEIQVTAVTRSRPCPQCGQSIMLQVAGRTSRLKHKALLMAPTPPTDNQLPKPDLSESSPMVPGDAFERMCLDPELIRTRRQLTMGVASVCVCIVIAAVLHFRQPPPRPMEPAAPAVAVAATEPSTTPAPVRTGMPSPLMGGAGAPAGVPNRISFRPANREEKGRAADESQSVLEQFLSAATVDEKLVLVNDSIQVEPAMRAYYQTHQVGALSYSHIERQVISGGSFSEFRVVMRDGTKKFAAVVTTPEGPRVDWASFVALGDLEWEQMRQKRPAKPVLMRVLASAANHFTGAFSDSEKLSCVRFVPAGNPSASPVYGYIPTGSDLGRQILTWLASGGSDPVPLTVKLCYPEGAVSHDQAWISEVVVPGWVTVASNSPRSEGE